MKCAAYVRTASKNHADLNLEKQTEIIMAFISENNWQLDTIYGDVGSGVHKNRGLQALIEECGEGKFDVIVITDLTRISRTTELSIELINLFKMGKVHIVTTDNTINTFRDDISKLTIYSKFCANEFETMSRRIRAAKKIPKNSH
ncbi:recombinase family protein [Lysinibacillus macroides]|uniref:Resolvase/invertase-type recombinase catalytic domain-containing protein n=1 Tax=Lysinibacillus macroides TaxID=33935 RepID=A0A0N0CVR6_9BACI|nr:recombinase family protein [Lysinibacillus macroides]KOY81867.1 hypothetical protein ADM90_13225 [Lysinibacillus macroides]QPR67975.1 recombinase family protein [Lysinibacillus macroides]